MTLVASLVDGRGPERVAVAREGLTEAACSKQMDSSSGRSSVKASTFMTGGGGGKKGRAAPSAPTKLRGEALACPRSPEHSPR